MLDVKRVMWATGELGDTVVDIVVEAGEALWDTLVEIGVQAVKHFEAWWWNVNNEDLLGPPAGE